MSTQKKEIQVIDPRVLVIINSNPLFYKLYFKGYENGKIIYTDPTEHDIKKALADLEIFKQRQEAINKRNVISEGDWVILKDGTYDRVTVAWPTSGRIQVGGSSAGLFINQNGHGSYSGGCGRGINTENIENTNEVKEGRCWIFSGNSSGAGRGVDSTLLFKVYKEI
jgi:hypothetical protein